jgi:hypothetical protein
MKVEKISRGGCIMKVKKFSLRCLDGMEKLSQLYDGVGMTFPEMDLYHGGGKDVLDVGGKAVSRKQKGEKLMEVKNLSHVCKKLSHGSGRAVS